jgi:3-deoxy-D-manno-octulosonic-acid transferase
MGFERNNDSTENPFTLIGASTWPGEETLLLKAQKYCLDAGIPCELILVPRHVERREAIQKLLNEQPLSWSSANGDSGNLPINNDSNQAIFFSDTTGNLVHLLKLADLAFIGKSMPPNDGGQTPIEAVAQGIPILFGPNMSNFKTISGELLEVGAARCISSQSELNEQVLRLAKDSQTRGQMKEAGLNWHEANKGIIADIGNAILQTLKLS